MILRTIKGKEVEFKFDKSNELNQSLSYPIGLWSQPILLEVGSCKNLGRSLKDIRSHMDYIRLIIQI
jgi:hypothetical protein